MDDRLEELRHELEELRRDLDHEPRERLPGRIGSLILVAVEALEALEAEAGGVVRRRWQLVDVAEVDASPESTREKRPGRPEGGRR